MPDGRKSFSSEHRLQALSTSEIVERFEFAILLLARDIKFRGRRLKPCHMLNALAFRFVELTPKERLLFARKAIADLEHFLAED